MANGRCLCVGIFPRVRKLAKMGKKIRNYSKSFFQMSKKYCYQYTNNSLLNYGPPTDDIGSQDDAQLILRKRI